MILPEKKYEPKHNRKLKNYAQGWNILIHHTRCKCNEYSDEIAEEYLAELKETICACIIFPFYEGQYDCILEIERLNAERKLDNLFQDSLEALDKLNIRGA